MEHTWCAAASLQDGFSTLHVRVVLEHGAGVCKLSHAKGPAGIEMERWLECFIRLLSHIDML